VNLQTLLEQIEAKTANLLNQIVFCGIWISDVWIQVKVINQMWDQKAVEKEDLKKRFLKIKQLCERRVSDFLLMQPVSCLVFQIMSRYKDHKFFRKRLVGGEVLIICLYWPGLLIMIKKKVGSK
jgi:hypothetical protein